MAIKYRRIATILFSLIVILGCLNGFVGADNTEVQSRFDQMADSSVSADTTHNLGFTLDSSASALGSIEFQFCSNNPLEGTPCTPPTGFSISGATLSSQAGNTGFSVSPLTSANDLILSNGSVINSPSLSPNLYIMTGVVNPSTVGTFYIRIYTYSSLDATGIPTETGGVALSTAVGLSVVSYVPPFLEFCAGAVIYNNDCSTIVNYIVNMGDIADNQTAVATSQFLGATNASGGYSVSVTGTTLTSGNNTIPSLSTPSPSIIGQDQFGMNLRVNDIPSFGSDPIGEIDPLSPTPVIASNYDAPNFYTFNNNDSLVSIPRPSLPVTYTVGYITNASAGQPVGVYTTTLTYICLANF
jgi:hypothetical protein